MTSNSDWELATVRDSYDIHKEHTIWNIILLFGPPQREANAYTKAKYKQCINCLQRYDEQRLNWIIQSKDKVPCQAFNLKPHHCSTHHAYISIFKTSILGHHCPSLAQYELIYKDKSQHSLKLHVSTYNQISMQVWSNRNIYINIESYSSIKPSIYGSLLNID